MNQIVIVSMWAAGYLLAPLVLIAGWAQWASTRNEGSRPPLPSLIGFIASTTSALLAVATIAYAVLIHSFPYYDPTLLRIFRWGFLLSLSGFLLGCTGIAKANALRWQAPVADVAMLAFWFVAASSE